MSEHFDIIVIGGGHAGAEAAWAGANLGARIAIVTLDSSKIGVMSCNPAIGGLAKGQIVREIDALGGLMALATDATGIMFKTLNTSKGAAVHGPRAQCDKHAYARQVQSMLAGRDVIEIIEGAVEEIVVELSVARGVRVRTTSGLREIRASAVVLTSGTFMRGLMHQGERKTPGGRVGEGAASAMSETLRRLGFELARLKTGTPPRVRRSSIDWDALEMQTGDAPPMPMSDLSSQSAFPLLTQVECRITKTTPEAHESIRRNLDRAPMYNGQLESAGPRYCPSIEDKVVRFSDRESHHVFLEPESLEDESVYCNGISTSLPADVQEEIVRSMAGCAQAEILQYGYAVEYDMSPPHQIDATCMTKRVEGLFFAGQINGTSGYEEAAGQGLLAGLNAVRFARGETLITLGRDEAYIGVMLDDLVTKTPVEPYRMFTSRAEHRLLLRADNSADRLTARGRQWSLVCDRRWTEFERRSALLTEIRSELSRARIDGVRLIDLAKRPGFEVRDLRAALSASASATDQILTTVLAEIQYEGYIRRQAAEIKRHAEMETREIPIDFDFESITGLRSEARLALCRFRPRTFGQAGRLEGVNPADLSLLLISMRRHRQRESA